MSRLRLLVLVAAIPLALWMLSPVLSDGAPLSSRIEEKKQEIDKDKGRERVLTTTISGYTERIDTLQGDITVLEGRQARIQADLDAKRAAQTAWDRDHAEPLGEALVVGRELSHRELAEAVQL